VAQPQAANEMPESGRASMNDVDTPGDENGDPGEPEPADAGHAEAAELERLRAEVAEWRRRAEVAEAVAAERLVRAETAEKALDATRAVRPVPEPAGDATVAPATVGADEPAAAPAADAPVRPRSLRERWRRYIDSVN
jgi:hypothetical protein